MARRGAERTREKTQSPESAKTHTPGGDKRSGADPLGHDLPGLNPAPGAGAGQAQGAGDTVQFCCWALKLVSLQAEGAAL